MRYISASERARALGYGLMLYSKVLDMSEDNLGYKEAIRAWEDWEAQWGSTMANKVRQLQEDNFTWSIDPK